MTHKLVILFALLHFIYAVTGNCGENEEPTSCYNYCERTCENPNPPPCKYSCVPGCHCKNGYVRNKEGGKCVPKTDCGGVIFKSNTTVACNNNEEFTDCESPCLPTCSVPEPPMCILLWCRQGCFCKDGYIKEKVWGKCIPKSSCPVIST